MTGNSLLNEALGKISKAGISHHRTLVRDAAMAAHQGQQAGLRIAEL